MTNEEETKKEQTQNSPAQAPVARFINFLKANIDKELQFNAEPDLMNASSAFNRSRRAFNKKRAETTNNNNSDKYFSILFWLFLVVNIRYDLYFVVAVIVLAWKLVKNCVYYSYKLVTESSSFQEYWFPMATEWVRLRSDALMPGPFIFLMALFVKGDHRANQWLQKSMDKIVSGLMIVFLLMFIVFAFTFLSIQVHSESIQLVENVFNENLYNKPYLRNWLPEKESVNKFYQEAVNNLYFYGREWLTERLKTSAYNTTTPYNVAPTSANDNSSVNSYKLLEKQLLKQWDVIYIYLSRNATKSWNAHNSTLNDTVLGHHSKPEQKNSTLELSREKLYKNLKRMVSFVNGRDSFDYQYFAVIFKDNLGTVYAILDSTYRILKGNFFLYIYRART